MKFTTLIAAGALAIASSTATAGNLLSPAQENDIVIVQPGPTPTRGLLEGPIVPIIVVTCLLLCLPKTNGGT